MEVLKTPKIFKVKKHAMGSCISRKKKKPRASLLKFKRSHQGVNRFHGLLVTFKSSTKDYFYDLGHGLFGVSSVPGSSGQELFSSAVKADEQPEIYDEMWQDIEEFLQEEWKQLKILPAQPHCFSENEQEQEHHPPTLPSSDQEILQELEEIKVWAGLEIDDRLQKEIEDLDYNELDKIFDDLGNYV